MCLHVGDCVLHGMGLVLLQCVFTGSLNVILVKFTVHEPQTFVHF